MLRKYLLESRIALDGYHISHSSELTKCLLFFFKQETLVLLWPRWPVQRDTSQ
jgi:hypothetical protein